MRDKESVLKEFLTGNCGKLQGERERSCDDVTLEKYFLKN